MSRHGVQEGGKSRPVLIAMSTLAGLQALTAGAGFTEIVPAKVAGFIVLVIAAAQVGIQFYVQNLTVPLEDVAAYRNKAGEVVSGPVVPPVQEPVEVVHEDEPVPADPGPGVVEDDLAEPEGWVAP